MVQIIQVFSFDSQEMFSINLFFVKISAESFTNDRIMTQSTHPYYRRNMPNVGRSRTKLWKLHNNATLQILRFSSSSLLLKFSSSTLSTFRVFSVSQCSIQSADKFRFSPATELAFACFVHNSLLTQEIFHYDGSINPLRGTKPGVWALAEVPRIIQRYEFASLCLFN